MHFTLSCMKFHQANNNALLFALELQFMWKMWSVSEDDNNDNNDVIK